MEKEIILRANVNRDSDPCTGCIYLKKNPKSDTLDCNIPLDFNYSKYGNCGKKSSCVYMYKGKNEVKAKKGHRKRGAVTTEEQISRDAYTQKIIDSVINGNKTVKEIAIELKCEKRVIYNRIFSYARRKKLTIDILHRKCSEIEKIK